LKTGEMSITTLRPHSSLNNLTPTEYAKKISGDY